MDTNIDLLVEQTKGWKCEEVELTLKDDPMVNVEGKLLSDEVLNNKAVKVAIRKSWRTSAIMDIYGVEENVFIFIFCCQEDKRRISSQDPWTIIGPHMILKEWDPDAIFEEIDFSSSAFWVQVKGLPVQKQTRENAEIIGHSFGKV
ncbi:hypothetical protein Tsubulata_027885 [Turnera subulata]|uniref:DUF4283 domain-containing protein n=1 Tax=Turnera subulata TaxID=218843 RepID=A0A9Q0JQZ4_9ROSI|nr:hypothetical protein Tsubulata_027885 [Turnera subulata]